MTSQKDRIQNPANKERRPRKRRGVRTLDHALGKRLFAYALAAGAGVVVPSEAMAKIVYTPAHDSTVGNPNGMNIDLNHDGIVDFNIVEYNFSGPSFISVFGNGNEIVYGSAPAH